MLHFYSMWALAAAWTLSVGSASESCSTSLLSVSMQRKATPTSALERGSACGEGPPANQPSSSFESLVKASRSDKWYRHHYEYMYERWLAPYRHAKDLQIVEIGAEHGKSLNLWDQYFTDAKLILGMAYGGTGDTKQLNNESKVVVYHGDQSSSEAMQHLLEVGPWDIVIDDGSHVPQHMMYSFFALWKGIKPGGLYVIEDLETNYWPDRGNVYGYRLDHPGIGEDARHSAVTKLEQLSRVLLRHGLSAELSIMPGDDEICSVEWGMNLVAIRKCTAVEKIPSPPAPTSTKLDGLQRWLDDARASNPADVPLPAAAPSNHVPSCASRPEEGSFTAALQQVAPPPELRQMYQKDYARWLADFRSMPGMKLVELGSGVGPSLKLWASYFQQPGDIVGVERDGAAAASPLGDLSHPASVLLGGDVSTDTLSNVIGRGPWDVIVDDGSQTQQRVTSLFALWRSLKPGGLYVFENAGADAWASLLDLGAETSATLAVQQVSLVSKLEQIKQVLVRYEIGNHQMSVMPGDETLCTIDWGKNIVALRKCTAEVSAAGKRYKGKKKYDERRMREWMAQAVSTNPS